MNPYRFSKFQSAVNIVSVLVFSGVLAFHFFPNLRNNLSAAEPTNSHNVSTKTAESKASAKARAAQASFFSTMDSVGQKLDGNFDIAIYDVAENQTYTYRKGTESNWWMASTAKVSILTELLLAKNSDGSDFDENLVGEVQSMIRTSDNGATESILANDFPNDANPLQTLFGRFNMKDSISGIEQGGNGWGLSRTSAPDQIKLLKNIFISSNILSKAQQAYIWNEMQNVDSDQRWGISGFSSQIKTLAVKDGWGVLDNNNLYVDNSIGSVTLQNGRQYLIAAYGDGFSSDDEGMANQEELIATAGVILAQ